VIQHSVIRLMTTDRAELRRPTLSPRCPEPRFNPTKLDPSSHPPSVGTGSAATFQSWLMRQPSCGMPERQPLSGRPVRAVQPPARSVRECEGTSGQCMAV
jgi:hypothetical protein